MEQSSPKKRNNTKRTTTQPKKDMILTNPENENSLEIGSGNDWLSIKSSTIVRVNETIWVQHNNGPLHLKVDISADFGTIPKEYHEIFLNIMSARYVGKVNFGDNPFSQCRPVQKRKWWQFWKSKYFTI